MWKAPDIGGYFFLGGVAGGSALLAAGADLTARPAMRRSARLITTGAVGLSLATLVHARFAPALFVALLRATVSPTDRAALHDDRLAARLRLSEREAFRQGNCGPTYDIPVEQARAFSHALRGASDNVVAYVKLPGGQHAFDLFHSPRFESVIDGIEAFATAVRSARNVPSRRGRPSA